MNTVRCACPVSVFVLKARFVEVEKEIPGGIDIEGYKGVWIFAEQRGGKVSSVAYELLGIGRKLADDLKTDLSAVLLGTAETEAKELIRWGADKVYLSKDQIFESFNDEPYSQLLTSLITEHRPEIVLAGATPMGRSFIPRVAARLRTGLTADCTSLAIDERNRQSSSGQTCVRRKHHGHHSMPEQ